MVIISARPTTTIKLTTNIVSRAEPARNNIFFRWETIQYCFSHITRVLYGEFVPTTSTVATSIQHPLPLTTSFIHSVVSFKRNKFTSVVDFLFACTYTEHKHIKKRAFLLLIFENLFFVSIKYTIKTVTI